MQGRVEDGIPENSSNTFVIENAYNDMTIVVYHDTGVTRFNRNVVKLCAPGTVGGEGSSKTQTTKLRMNQASFQYGLGYMVKQRGNTWSVHKASVDADTGRLTAGAKVREFTDRGVLEIPRHELA